MDYYFTAEEKNELGILPRLSLQPDQPDGEGEDEEGEVEVSDDGGRGVPAVPDKK